MELTWVLTPFHKKNLSDKGINRGLVCAYMHSIARTQKILTFISETCECRQQKHTQHAPSTKTECDTSMVGLTTKTKQTKKKKKTATYAKISPKMVNPRDIAGERRRRRNKTIIIVNLSVTACVLSQPVEAIPPRWPSGKGSTSRAEDPRFKSRLRRDFFGVESHQ